MKPSIRKSILNCGAALAMTMTLGFGIAHAAPSDVNFTIATSEAVNVDTGGGTPRIAVDVGGVTRYATYSAGTGTSSLTFSYSPVAGDVDLDGVTLTSPIDLNGGGIADLNGNPMTDLSFVLPNTSGIKINYPSLSMDFIYDADGRYTLNGTAYNDLSSFLTATGGTFSRASTATYFDSSGDLQTAAVNELRFDYDPVTYAAKGVLIEEARTNLLTNSTMFGAGVGVAPTGWALSVTGGLTLSVVGTGTEQGMNYVDVRLHGTTTATTYPSIYLNNIISIPAILGDTHTLSARARMIAGSLSEVRVSNVYRNSIGALVPGGGVSTNLSSLSDLSLTTITTTATDAASTYISPRIYLGRHDPPAAVDGTVRIMVPQLEKASFPTSYIPTTSGAVTRAEDNTVFPINSWFNATSGTAYADWAKYVNQNALVFEFKDGSGSTYDRLNVFSGTQKARLQIFPAGNTVIDSVGTYVPFVEGNTVKAAMTYASGNSAVTVDGVAPLTSATTFAAVSNYTELNIGQTDNGVYGPPISTKAFNGHIRQFKYYPARVSDAQLQLLTQ